MFSWFQSILSTKLKRLQSSSNHTNACKWCSLKFVGGENYHEDCNLQGTENHLMSRIKLIPLSFPFQVVLMMIIVVLMFSVCWLPQNVYFIVTTYYPSVNTHPYIQEIYLGIYWLAMSNSMYNPIIYCIYSER